MKEIIFSNDNFVFAKRDGIGMYDTPYAELEVKSQGKAEEYIVEVRLQSQWQNFDGEAFQYKYYDVHVSHGMRSHLETLPETREYIEVLQDAINFAERINTWLDENPEWKAH